MFEIIWLYCIGTIPHCLTFDFHMFCSTCGMGELIVYSSNNNSDVTTLFRDGDQNNQWDSCHRKGTSSRWTCCTWGKISFHLFKALFLFLQFIMTDKRHSNFWLLQCILLSIILFAYKKYDAVEHSFNFSRGNYCLVLGVNKLRVYINCLDDLHRWEGLACINLECKEGRLIYDCLISRYSLCIRWSVTPLSKTM